MATYKLVFDAIEEDTENTVPSSVTADENEVTTIESSSEKEFKRFKFNLYKYSGTVYSLIKSVEFVRDTVEFDEIVEWFNDTTGELNPYEFSITLSIEDEEVTPSLITELEEAINKFKNVRSWLDAIIVSYLVKTDVFAIASTTSEIYAEAVYQED